MLWLPGGLAWTVGVGWLVMVLGVARPPTMAELTFLGARFYTSGAWPWNLLAVLALIVLLTAIALVLSATAEATLIRGRPASGSDVRRVLVVSFVCVLPVAVALGLVAVGIAAVAPAEVNAPRDGGGPLVRIAVRVLPLLVATGVIMVACGAWHAAAARSALAGRSVLGALVRAPTVLAASAAASAVAGVMAFVLRVVLVAVGTTLLRVLWEPVAQRLVLDGIGFAIAMLLVGFVAIWLCVVLLGGALHAWASLTWSRLLRAAQTPVERSPQP